MLRVVSKCCYSAYIDKMAHLTKRVHASKEFRYVAATTNQGLLSASAVTILEESVSDDGSFHPPFCGIINNGHTDNNSSTSSGRDGKFCLTFSIFLLYRGSMCYLGSKTVVTVNFEMNSIVCRQESPRL
jgi:hypothetical protein